MRKQMYQNYIEKLNEERVNSSSLTVERIKNLGTKECLICSTSTVELGIMHKLTITETSVIESENEYIVLDAFGYIIWTDDAKGTFDYIQGFTKE